jgi:hypothetical protein
MIHWIGPPLHMDILSYHRHAGISKSKLDSIAQSPLHYWAKWLDPNRVESEPTPAMEFGTAVHTAVLEPDRFTFDYQLAPDVSRTTKAGKAAWEEAAAGGKKLLKADEWHQIEAIRASIFAHPMAGKILRASGRAERSFIADCPQSGLQLKSRPDYLTDSGWIVDLKTTVDASARSFQRSCANFRYHVQAAHYLNVYQLCTGEPARGFIFIAVEKTAPYAVQVFEASPTFIQVGAAEVRRNLTALARAIDSYPIDVPWPGYSEDVVQLEPPSWLTPNLPEM